MNQIIHNHKVLPYTFNSIVTGHNGEVLQEQLVKSSGRNYKVIYNNNATIVIFEDGSKGVAKKHPRDTYNRQVGHDIAFNRARIIQLQKEINEISKTQYVPERRIFQ